MIFDYLACFLGVKVFFYYRNGYIGFRVLNRGYKLGLKVMGELLLI